jgi:hypothetical protein
MCIKHESLISQICNVKTFFLCGISTLFIQAFATPFITGFSGVIVDRSTITITGKMFANKANAAPIKFDSFENGVNDTALNRRDPSWQKYGDGAKYSNTTSHSGTLSVKSAITNGESFNTNYFTYNAPSSGVFISYWWRTLNGDNTDKTIVKLTRICSSTTAGGGGVYNGTGNTSLGGTFDFSSRCGPYCAYDNGATTETVLKQFAFPPLNQWQKIEMFKKLSTPGVKDGIVECRILGVDYAIDTAALTRAAGQSFKLNTVLLGLMEGNSQSHNYEAYIDDIYIDSTRARIEIGNASTWSACSIREIQLPTVWTDTLLKCSLNLGQFTSSSKLYLYIVDTDGRVNANGFPLFTFQAGFAPTYQQKEFQGICKISFKPNSPSTMKLVVSPAEKGNLSLSVFDMSGKKFWNKRISGSSKSEFIIPLLVTPFIVNVAQQQNNYSKIYCLSQI